MRSDKRTVIMRDRSGRHGIGMCYTVLRNPRKVLDEPCGIYCGAIKPTDAHTDEFGQLWYAKRPDGEGNAFVTFTHAVRWLAKR